MKRDMDTVREILLAIEAQPQENLGQQFAPSAISQTDLEIHLPLLLDRGLIEAKCWSGLKFRSWAMVRLTWEGHDFLDTVRDPDIWRKTKDGAAAAGGFSLDLLKALARGLVKKKIEHHTGIELDL